MRRDSEISLVRAMTTIKAQQEHLQELSNAAQLVANMVEPLAEGVEPHPLVDRIRDVPVRITSLIQGMAKSVSKQLLGFVKLFYPKADLSPVAEGVAADCSDETYR